MAVKKERWVGTERERKQLSDRYIPGIHVAKPQIRAERGEEKTAGALISSQAGEGREDT